jgi:hypothetical protein
MQHQPCPRHLSLRARVLGLDPVPASLNVSTPYSTAPLRTQHQQSLSGCELRRFQSQQPASLPCPLPDFPGLHTRRERPLWPVPWSKPDHPIQPMAYVRSPSYPVPFVHAWPEPRRVKARAQAKGLHAAPLISLSASFSLVSLLLPQGPAVSSAAALVHHSERWVGALASLRRRDRGSVPCGSRHGARGCAQCPLALSTPPSLFYCSLFFCSLLLRRRASLSIWSTSARMRDEGSVPFGSRPRASGCTQRHSPLFAPLGPFLFVLSCCAVIEQRETSSAAAPLLYSRPSRP